MTNTAIRIVFAVAAYLLGAIPFGFLIARARGVRIQEVGSGNIGATNVGRCVGRRWGLLTFACDALKGFAAAFFLPALFARHTPLAPSDALRVAGAVLAVVGHNWPVTLGFKGGKGVATSAGALLGVAWLPVAIGAGAWVAVFLLGRYVSLASILAAFAAAVCGWILYANQQAQLPVPLVLAALAGMMLWRHRGNLRRLANGTEPRFGKIRKSAKTDPAQLKPPPPSADAGR